MVSPQGLLWPSIKASRENEEHDIHMIDRRARAEFNPNQIFDTRKNRDDGGVSEMNYLLKCTSVYPRWIAQEGPKRTDGGGGGGERGCGEEEDWKGNIKESDFKGIPSIFYTHHIVKNPLPNPLTTCILKQ